MNLFENRKLVIATNHGKEKVLGPLFSLHFGSTYTLANDLNTDLLGTFSGEIERKLTPIDAAREKCNLAMNLTGCDLAIASEGSFGPHPEMFFVPANEELLLLVDRKHEFEIFAKILTTNTNFSGEEVESFEELQDFAKQIGFPSHKLILKKEKESCDYIFKGIASLEELEKAFETLIQGRTTLFVETDMRAMHNPTRLNVIYEVGQQLIEKAKSLCPNCSFPGFSITYFLSGLPCSECSMPTKSTKFYMYNCVKCGFEEKEPNSKKEFEDPMYCDFCNP